MNVNVLAWNDDERRVGSLGALGAAVVVVLGALAAWWFVAATPAWVYWILAGLLVLVLVLMVVLLFVNPGARAAPPAAAEAHAHAEHAPHDPAAQAAPTPAEAAAFVPRALTLRCGDCGTIFDVTDTGERPLYHTCPGCGAEGALRDAAEPAPEAAPEAAYAPPEPAPAPAPAAAAPVAPAPAAPAIKRIKLRCGGCKEVFSIEDSGERPLRRACPHCGRMGQIN